MHLIDKIISNKDSKIRLLCFHYAGGSSVSFYSWKNRILHPAELMAVDLPGRGRSIIEPLLSNIDDVTTTLLQYIKHYTDKPLVFFGHSVGSLICFELAKVMKAEGLQPPVHLILSGCIAPQNLYKRRQICDFDTKEFVEALKLYNGISQEVLNEPSLMEIFLPIIRADISIIEKYKYRGNDPLNCNITTIGSTDDPTVLIEDIKPWISHTSMQYDHHTLKGNHFFIRTDIERLLDIINHIIAKYCYY